MDILESIRNNCGEISAVVGVKAANNHLDGNTKQQETMSETSPGSGSAGVAGRGRVYDTWPVVNN